MKLPFFHFVTYAKYSELVAELKSERERIKNLEMWYNRHLTEIYKLRDLHSKEKARKIQHIQNFCHGKD